MKSSLALGVLLTHNPSTNITWVCWVKFKDDIHGGKAEIWMHDSNLHVEEKGCQKKKKPTKDDIDAFYDT